MTSAVSIFNSAITRIFDLLLTPFNSLPKIWGLIFLSVLSGIVLLMLYGKVSNQNGLKRVKKRIGSLVLEAVLYRHDLRTSLNAQLKMLREAFVYLGYAAPPLLILMLPCLIVLAQMNLRYGYSGLGVGEKAVLRVSVDKPEALDSVKLADSAGVSATLPVRVKESNEVYFRVQPTEQGKQTLVFEYGGSQRLEKQLYGTEKENKIPTVRFKAWWWNFLYPGVEPIAADAPFSEISLSYPELRYPLLGIKMHWLVVFAIVSLLAGLAAAKLLQIEI